MNLKPEKFDCNKLFNEFIKYNPHIENPTLINFNEMDGYFSIECTNFKTIRHTFYVEFYQITKIYDVYIINCKYY
jgi:hypothetical protein